MCHHLRMDNIEYYRRGSHGLCRIVLLKDQGNVWFFVSLDMFEVYQQVGLLTEFVFSNVDGRIHARVISGYMKRRTSNEGFTNPKSIHTARRTLNSELLASGAPRTMCCAMIGNTERVNEEYYTYDVSSTSEKMEIVTRINSRVTSNANGNRNDGSP